jgi:hypothetical protein
MRGIRFALFAGWMAMTLLAVAGFAAFSTAEPPQTTGTSQPALSDLGTATGSLSALAFTYLVENAQPDPLEGAELLEILALSRRSTATTTVPPAADPPAFPVAVSAPAATTTVPITTPTLPRPPAVVLSEAEVRGLVTTYFRPEDVERAIQVAFCESNFNASAVNPRTGASGLFQHMPRYWNERSTLAGWAGASFFDPQASTAVAAWLFYSGSGGWAHWDC